jgi:hypothetical protein
MFSPSRFSRVVPVAGDGLVVLRDVDAGAERMYHIHCALPCRVCAQVDTSVENSLKTLGTK